MSEDDLERRLRDAFDARARASVSDHASAPAPRFATDSGQGRRHGRVRILTPLAAAVAVLVVVASVLALQHSGGNRHQEPAAARTSVHIQLDKARASSYGVGMPVVAHFSRAFSDARSLSAATSITVNGKPAHGAWYFEQSTAAKGYPIEGHLRLRTFWPAHSTIRVTLATKGVPAGHGFAFDDGGSVDFTTGAKTIAVVDDAKHRMIVRSDGKFLGSYPVSLGSPSTPTSRGIKVIMQKGASICMSGPGYDLCGIKYTQRLTDSGEYLHAAPWNVANIKSGVDSSNGCTNLLPSDAQRLYKVFEVGDVVDYPDARGTKMAVWDGLGDWNVPWRVWERGGLVPTR